MKKKEAELFPKGVGSLCALQAILSKANPSYIHIVGIIASSEGLEYLKENAPVKNYTIWIGAEDSEMNAKSYIIPGLGDAGDLAYGEKK